MMNRSVGLLMPPQLVSGSQRRQSLILRRADTQNDTFCSMPAKMRCICIILTCLLMLSLISAIINSMQTSSIHSESYCLKGKEKFDRELLCPAESIIFYYKCCDGVCCQKVKIWMIVAAINLLVSIVVCAFYMTKYTFT